MFKFDNDVKGTIFITSFFSKLILGRKIITIPKGSFLGRDEKRSKIERRQCRLIDQQEKCSLVNIYQEKLIFPVEVYSWH